MKEMIVGRIVQDGKNKGTGFLVAPDLVMTAKHNVINPSELLKGPYEEKEVVFKIDNEDKVIGTTINLVEAIEEGIDCVLIRLSEIISQDKMFELVDARNNITGLECKIVGYPKIRGNILTLSATIVNFQDGKMIVKINENEQLSDYEGMSGSPIVALGNVVGIVIIQEDCERLEALPVGYVSKVFEDDSFVVRKRKLPLDISETTFNMEKISQQVERMVSIVGPRYNKKLNIKTGTYSNLCFLLGKGELEDRLQDISSKLDACIGKLQSFDSYNQNESDLVLQESRKRIADIVDVLEVQRDYLISDKHDEDEIKHVPGNIKECEKKLFDIFEVEKQRFEEKNGVGTYNNKSWRGFMASYMCTFPTHYLDELKSVITVLPIIAGLFDDILLINPDKKVILITGRGGIGKTHLLCDIVNNYIERDIPAILLLGDTLNINDTISEIITNEYCKGDKIENLLGWLNEYGEQNDVYIPVCIDAINEVEDSSYWNRNLPILTGLTELYPNVKVIVSCRSIYLEEYLDENIIDNMVKLPHEGFGEIEYEAFNKFCEYYDVHISYETVYVPEFMNPLFLRMLCEIASENDDRTVIVDDINSLMEKYFDKKNKIISRNYPEAISVKDKVVQLALANIAEHMTNNDQYYISWNELRKIIKEVLDKFGLTGKVSGFIKKLISENILREADGEDKSITFAYQKFFEYIYAVKYVNEDINTILDAIEKKNITLGTLEMIQILFFRKTGKELIRKADGSIHGELVESFMSGLYWRKKQDFNDDTVSEVDELLSSNDSDIRRVITGLISVSTKNDCPVNALYIHKKLSAMKACKRDIFMSNFLIKQYNQNRTLSEICERAISLRKNDYSYDNIFLWKLMLCWGTSSNDIKLRDKASKGLVNLFRLYPKDMINIVKMFSNIDDDYISERIWQVLYSALIFLSDPEYTIPVLNYIKKNIIEPGVWPQNILLRNYLRNIYEFAFVNGWITEKEVLFVRPPYKSKKHSANHQFASANQDDYKKLFWNCQDSDFAIYTIPSEVEDYGITKKDVGVMIFEDIIKGGYNNLCKDLDARIDYQYGSLRSRDSEIERIGKKYQRIYLYREMGNIFDNYDYKPRYDWQENSEELECGNSFRSIDLTIIPQLNEFKEKKFSYPFFRFRKMDDLTWFSKKDVERYILKTMKKYFKGEEFIILQGYYSARESDEMKYPYRDMWIQVRTYLCNKQGKSELLKWFENKDFEGRWMPEGLGQISECCLGEYFWDSSIDERSVQSDEYFWGEETPPPCKLIVTTNDYLNEKDSPLCTYEDISYMLPSKYLIEKMNLKWDGGYGFGVDGNIVIANFSDNSLCINKRFLLDFLEKNNMDIVWTVLGEKQTITGRFGNDYPGRAEFSYTYYFNEEVELSKNFGMYNVVKPQKQ